MALEEALKILGTHGRYQILAYILIGLSFGLTTPWQLFAIIFIGFIHPYTCNNQTQVDNATLTSYPVVSQTLLGVSKDQCTKNISFTYVKDGMQVTEMNEKVKCDKFIYDKLGFTNTMYMEWDLVCDKDGRVELSQLLFNVGVVCGFFLVPVGDWLGRKKVFFICEFFMALFGVAMSFSTNFIMFCSMQFLTGAFAAGMYMMGLVISVEIFRPHLRSILAPLTMVFTSVGACTLSIWAYFLRDWRHLQLGISAAGALGLIYFFWCPESIRWLIAKEKYDEAEKLLETAAKFNGVKMPKGIIRDSDQRANFNHNESIFQYLRTPKPLRYVLIMIFLVFTNNLMFFGLSLMMGAMPGNWYLNFFINSVVEIPAILLSILVMNYYGRRIPICVQHVCGGICMMVAAAVVGFSDQIVARGNFTVKQIEAVMLTMAFFTKLFVSAAYGVELIYAQEIFPTNMRSTGLGITSGAGFIGSIIAPYTAFLYRRLPWAPLLIFAVLSLLAGVAALGVVETMDRPLPENIQTIVDWPLAFTEEEKRRRREERRHKRMQKKAGKMSNTSLATGNGNLGGNLGNYNDSYIPEDITAQAQYVNTGSDGNISKGTVTSNGTASNGYANYSYIAERYDCSKL